MLFQNSGLQDERFFLTCSLLQLTLLLLFLILFKFNCKLLDFDSFSFLFSLYHGHFCLYDEHFSLNSLIPFTVFWGLGLCQIPRMNLKPMTMGLSVSYDAGHWVFHLAAFSLQSWKVPCPGTRVGFALPFVSCSVLLAESLLQRILSFFYLKFYLTQTPKSVGPFLLFRSFFVAEGSARSLLTTTILCLSFFYILKNNILYQKK